jgi:hypothetical protein
MATGDSRQIGTPQSLAVNRAMLATARGRRKRDVVLDAPDPRAFVRQLPAEDLYFAIREIGLTDSVEIVAFASPLQFRAFVDLDAWQEHLPVPAQVTKWLEIAAVGARTPQEFRAKRKALDPELILVVLKAMTVVHPLEENDNPVLTSTNFIETAEHKYIVEIMPEGPEGATVRRLIEDFIDEDPFTATRLFEAVRWESNSELEETSLRWRTGRLRDMGFPDMEEALHIWAPLPKTWKPASQSAEPGPVAGVPALLLVSSRAPLFLDRVAERLPDAARPAFNEGLIYLLNCAIVADGIDPKDLDLARDTLAATRDMLSLGLELTAAGNEDAALAILGATPPQELFRLAVGRLNELARQAVLAAKGVSFGTAGSTALDSPDAELISGIRRKRPRLYDPPGPGEKDPPSGSWRAFRTLADLHTAEEAIQRATVAGEALHAAGLTNTEVTRIADAAGRAPTAVTVSQLLLTGAIHRILIGEGEIAPLPSSRVTELCALFDSSHLTESARRRLGEYLGSLRERISMQHQVQFETLAASVIQRFEEEVGAPCMAGGIEPQFVECLLIAGPVLPPPEVRAD